MLREPLELLYDDGGPEEVPLPPELESGYGGRFRLAADCVVANFVASLDGVVAITSELQSSSIISGGSEADRFVMGILRATADCVLIGSGTLKGSPTSIWTAERVYPPAAPAYARLRTRLGLGARPALAVITASGSIDVDHPALEEDALVLTTRRGRSVLEGRLPPGAELVGLEGTDSVDPRAAIEALRSRGHRRILSEAGPGVTGSLLAAGVLDELFLTISPLVAGRGSSTGRLGFVEGRELLPEAHIAGRLTGIRRAQGYLFLRYVFEPASGLGVQQGAPTEAP